MATRSCPECGAQYVATVRRCIDCDVVLADDVAVTGDGEAAASTAAPVGRGDQVGYELEGWGNQLKESLDGMLVKAGIGRVWEAGALVVSAVDEERVDDLIATIEGDDLPELSDDTPRVALEIEGLDAEGHVELDARLLASSVPHAWDDEGDLIVAEADEEQVLAIIEEVLDGPAADDGDGLTAQNALSALYVAVDRLAKNPHDRKLATAYVRAADGVDDLAVPYGFATEDWDDLVAEVEQLASAVVAHADVVAPAAEPTADPADDEVPGSDADEVADPDGADDGDDGEPAAATTEDHGDDDAADALEAVDGDDEDDDDTDDTHDADDADDDDDGGSADADLGSVDGARAAARALRERLVDLV